MDLDLPTHSDASLYTLNINLNLPGEGYAGSALYFLAPAPNNKDGDDGDGDGDGVGVATVRFAPGTAVLHRGMTRHGARPLVGGARNNLVLWLHGGAGGDGDDRYVRFAPYPPADRMSVEERWSPSLLPLSEAGGFPPFAASLAAGP